MERVSLKRILLLLNRFDMGSLIRDDHLISFLILFLASFHGLVEIFSGMILFLCFLVVYSLRATKTVYVPFAFHMDVTYSVGVGD